MDSKREIKKGILFCSGGILLSWAIYLVIIYLPDIQALPVQEQQEELLALMWHLPSVFPALLGLVIFRLRFLNKRLLHLYQASFVVFILCYGWSIVVPGAMSAVLPLLVLWTVNAFLGFCLLDLFVNRKSPEVKDHSLK